MKYKIRTAKEVSELISRYESVRGRITQREFCKQEGVAPSCLHRYLSAAGKTKVVKKPGFVKVKTSAPKRYRVTFLGIPVLSIAERHV